MLQKFNPKYHFSMKIVVPLLSLAAFVIGMLVVISVNNQENQLLT